MKCNRGLELIKGVLVNNILNVIDGSSTTYYPITAIRNSR